MQLLRKAFMLLHRQLVNRMKVLNIHLAQVQQSGPRHVADELVALFDGCVKVSSLCRIKRSI